MIVRSILYDLIGAKQWSSISFNIKRPESLPIQSILEYFYEQKQDGKFENGCNIEIESGDSVCVYLIEENTLLLVVASNEFSKDELKRSLELTKKLSLTFREKGSREASKDFPELAGEILRERVTITFVGDEEPHIENSSGRALKQMHQFLRNQDYIGFGPFNVSINSHTFSSALENPSELLENQPAGIAIILGKPLPDQTIMSSLISSIRGLSSIPVLVIPGSDSELEVVRDYETEFQVELCDSVSEKPTYLVLSVLAMLGLSDMHPEYARDNWSIEEAVDSYSTEEAIDTEAEELGHQAFYVVDKKTGNPIFTYYYTSMEEVSQRAPNVVAAITSFNMGAEESSKTSFVQVGDLVYALIEVDDLIFTLVTGQIKDVEAIRNQFSFLPDLWKDEAPEFLKSTSDPYSSPPFTLKLLATLPPEEFQDKMRPVQKGEPAWDKFESNEVRDFLKAVWSSLDGKLEMSRLSGGTGPQMTVGAIHFLKSMNCIEMKLVIEDSNIPELVGEVDSEIKNMYSHIDQITGVMDGKKTVKEISEKTNIQSSVLIRVISDLYRRGIVTLRD